MPGPAGGQYLQSGGDARRKAFWRERFAFIALFGLLLAPLAILVAVASFFEIFANVADVRAGLFGATAAAAGLVVGTAIKMARKIPFEPFVIVIAVAIFAAIAIFSLPLLAVLALLLPASFVFSGAR